MLKRSLVLVMLFELYRGDYWSQRSEMLEREERQMVGGNLTLNVKERKVDAKLLKLKIEELDEGFANLKKYLPMHHFFEVKEDVERSKIYDFIRKLPKGCSLHSHDLASTSYEYMLNVTYRDNLYACVHDNGQFQLRFMAEPQNDCNWTSIKDLRRSNPNYDDYLKSEFTMIVNDPFTAYPDIDAAWKKFVTCSTSFNAMMKYKPAYVDHVRELFEQLYDDQVYYVEIRGSLPPLYDLNGRYGTSEETARIWLKVAEEFKRDHPKFQGVRIILSYARTVSNDTLTELLKQSICYKREFPDLIAGFDLVGQEDPGKPLIAYVKQLKQLSETNLTAFYHASETNWYGFDVDLNVIDAVLLHSKRIGHGYAIVKHPEVVKMLNNYHGGIELNPISNQVLRLVDDLRNHPGAVYIANGYPVVICNDDPVLWGAKGLSYDWYMVFMAMTSRQAGLKVLKQLAINSYLYNAMEDDERKRSMDEWNVEWNRFIDDMLKNL